jgi:hypothetical protein
MVKRASKPSSKSTGLTLGRKAWAKISAVEGIRPSKEAEAAFAEAEHLGLSPAERRERILNKYARPKK